MTLSLKELQQLQKELDACIRVFSDVLVNELTQRDEQKREKEIKNRFISTLLSVQTLHMAFGAKSEKGRIILPSGGMKFKVRAI